MREWGSSYTGIFKRLISDESGQATVEYILLLSATVIGSAALSRAILRGLENGILRFGNQLQKDLKTGRADLGIWSR